MTPTTQNAALTLSDFLFFQQPAVIYGIIIALIAIGAAFWLFGHRLHRILLTVVFLSATMLGGWYLGPIYNVNPLLSLTIGAILGAGVGYWFFNFWLGLWSSCLIFLILFSGYAKQIALPYLTAAANESQHTMLEKGIELAPGNAPIPTTHSANLSPAHTPATPVGNAWRQLEADLPKLSRAKYEDWPSWQKNFTPTLQNIWQQLQTIVPRLSLNIMLIAGVSIIFGGILAWVRPVFLNIAYTSLFGVLLTSCGLGILLTLRDTDQLNIFSGFCWAIPIAMLIVWLIGIGLQYWLLPPKPIVEDDAEDDNEEEAEHKDKKKR